MVRSVRLLELFRSFQCTIRGSVIDDDNFPVEAVLLERLSEERDDDGQVAPLVVRRQDHAVTVAAGHDRRVLGRVSERQRDCPVVSPLLQAVQRVLLTDRKHDVPSAESESAENCKGLREIFLTSLTTIAGQE